jgi:hypothetical protein
MTKIRALQSLSSSEYGKLRAGETGYCKPSTAKQLAQWGMAEIVSENEEAPVKEVKPFITMQGYEPKQESKPVLYDPEEKEEKQLTEEDAEKAEGKKNYDEERAETPKKKYK